MKKERKGLNVIDVVIILLLVALLGTAGYRIYTELTGEGPAGQGNIVLTFEAEVEDAGIVNHLYNGASVYFTSDNTSLGKLYDGNAEDGLGAVYVARTTENGTIILCGTLRLSAEASHAKDGEYYVLGGRSISVGSRISVYTETAVLNITVKGIG